MDLQVEPVPLGEFVRQSIDDLAVTISHPLLIEADHGPVVSIDRVRFNQILVNLVSNAAKFSPSDQPILVGVEADGTEARVSVQDHGPGIPAEVAEFIFEKFARLTRSRPGMGLGLYISRGIARAHGGDLTLAASGESGSTFVMRLPRSPD